MPSIRQLKYFEALARFEHFGRAADYCAVTQPALSVQIRELEDEIGISLIERGPRSIRLTNAGIEIAKRSEQILGSVRDLVDCGRHFTDVLIGKLNLGVIPSMAPYILPPLLPHLQARFLELDLHICETQTHALLELLLDGTLDVLLLALPINHSELIEHHLYDDRFVLALPDDYPIKEMERANRELLCANNLLLLEEGHCFRDQALAFCALRQPDASPMDTFGATTLSTIVQMVAANMGVTLLPEMSLDIEAEHGRVQLLRFEEPEPSRSVGLMWRSTSPRKTDFLALGEIIKEVQPQSRFFT